MTEDEADPRTANAASYPHAARPVLFAVALVSGAALAYEVLLTRLFSIIQWHHFAYMIISLALLGFGASGTFLSLLGRRMARRFGLAFAANAASFGIASVLCFALAQRVPFNPLEIAWSAGELLGLGAVYTVLMLPFFFGANCVALTFMTFPRLIARTYAYDLAGATGGSVGIVGLLFVLKPTAALAPIAGAGFAAAAMVALTARRERWLAIAAALGATVLLAWLDPVSLHVSQFKALSQATRISGARVAAVRTGPLGLLTAVENSKVPFRHAPGLSLNAPGGIPEQVAVFTDAGAPTMITRYEGEPERLVYLDYVTSALPYHLGAARSVLVLGAGGGAGVLQALSHGAERVDAVERNAQLVSLVRERYGEFAGHLYRHPEVRVHVGDARGFVSRTRRRYDLIQLSAGGAFGASAAGLGGLGESPGLTVEAFGAYLDRLTPSGMLAITTWVKVPPRDGVKLFATAVRSLERGGVETPARHLSWVRSWNTSTLVVGKAPFEPGDGAALRDFAEERSFDVAYFPGMEREAANRFNRLAEPFFFDAARALLAEERAAFLARYKFDVSPATDDRPYFSHFFKWRHLPEIFELRLRGGAGLLELGYLVLVATLVQAVVLSALLILLPLAWLPASASGGTRGSRLRVAAYFICIGLAFLFIEIAFMQRFVLFLDHPVYAIAVVLAGFLLFASLGSARSARLRAATSDAPIPRWPVLAIAGLGLAYAWGLPPLLEHVVALPGALRVVLALAIIAPLGFCMGMPFPTGLAALERGAPALVPWAWGLNGCASVVSAVLATLLALHLGITAVIVCAVALYVLAGVAGSRGFAPTPRRM